MEKPVDLGQEFSFDCPPHESSYGVSYSWQGKVNEKDTIQLKRTDRRAISPTGQLFIMYVIQEDIEELAEFQNQGIKCFMHGAGSYQSSGLLKLKKRTPGKTIFVYLYKRDEKNVLQFDDYHLDIIVIIGYVCFTLDHALPIYSFCYNDFRLCRFCLCVILYFFFGRGGGGGEG